MRKYDRIEEPPPVSRYAAGPPARSGPGMFADWRRRFGHRPRLEIHFAPLPGTRRAIVLGLAALGMTVMQVWMLNELLRVRDRLAVERAELDQARISLGLLWQITERLDEDQIVRLGELADSIRSVFAYAQGEVRLWETAYYAQEKRLDENAANIAGNGEAIARVTSGMRLAGTRLDELARVDIAYGSRVDALEHESRVHGTAVATLARRAGAQEADLLAVTSSLGMLRESLAGLDTELAGLENQVTTTGSAFGEMDTRVARLDGWIDGFRRAGLSGETVQTRLARLADELRRVTVRVDSLRSSGPAARISQLDH